MLNQALFEFFRLGALQGMVADLAGILSWLGVRDSFFSLGLGFFFFFSVFWLGSTGEFGFSIQGCRVQDFGLLRVFCRGLPWLQIDFG